MQPKKEMPPEKQPAAQLQPEPRLQQKTQQPKVTPNQKRNFWLGILTAAVIGFGGWALMPPGSPDLDNLTNDEKIQIQKEYEAVSSFSVEKISDPKEMQQAIASMELEPEQQLVLENSVKNGDIKMAWIQAWDNYAEDGDVLKFESQNYKITTTLMNKPVVFALPLAPGMNYVKVTGIHDGGGGITASVMTSSGATSVPVIDEGMSYTLPIN